MHSLQIKIVIMDPIVDNATAKTADTMALAYFRMVANPNKVDLTRSNPTSSKQQPPKPQNTNHDDLDGFWSVATPPKLVEPDSSNGKEAETKTEEETKENETGFYPKQLYGETKEPEQENTNREVRAEKQGFLHEFHEFSRRGFAPSRQYTMQDSLEDLEFEFDRLQQMEKTQSAVQLMKTFMVMGSKGIELVNKKLLRSAIPMKGWSVKVKEDVRQKKYDSAFARLYKKRWRRGSTSPETEILMIFLGSLLIQVANNIMKGVTDKKASSTMNALNSIVGSGQDTAADPVVINMRPPKASNVPFEKPPMQEERQEEEAEEPTRRSYEIQVGTKTASRLPTMTLPPSAARVPPSAARPPTPPRTARKSRARGKTPALRFNI